MHYVVSLDYLCNRSLRFADTQISTFIEDRMIDSSTQGSTWKLVSQDGIVKPIKSYLAGDQKTKLIVTLSVTLVRTCRSSWTCHSACISFSLHYFCNKNIDRPFSTSPLRYKLSYVRKKIDCTTNKLIFPILIVKAIHKQDEKAEDDNVEC